MAKLIITTNSDSKKEEMLNAVYNSDRSATFCMENKAVFGSVLVAIARGDQIEIASGYYCESSLRAMFS